MHISVVREKMNYRSSIDYGVSIDAETAWEWLATSTGLERWFPELHIEELAEGKILVFAMDDFREEMAVLEEDYPQLIRYQWDKAVVSFRIVREGEGSHVYFEEIIPVDYQNEFSSATNDMAGWAIHNERLSFLMNGLEAPAISDIHAKWEAYMENAAKSLE